MVLLSEVAPGAARIVQSRLRRVAIYEGPVRRKHFCDGTLFIRNGGSLPENVLAAYLYRVALENVLFKKWGLWEVILGNPRCILIVYYRELKVMEVLGCSTDYMNEQCIFIERHLAEMSKRDARKAEALRYRFDKKK